MPKPPKLVGACFLILILASCSQEYITSIASDDYENRALRDGLLNIENQQRDSREFANLGINRFSSVLNVILLANALLAGVAGAIAGSNLWSERAKLRRVLLLVLAISVSASSATGVYVKNESTRFYEEDRHKHTALSLDMDDVITNFYIEFEKANYNDAAMEQPATRAEFLDLQAGTLRRLKDLRKEYSDEYRLSTN